MTKIERNSGKLMLQSGGTTLTLDKQAGKAVLQRKVLFWTKKPVETALDEIKDVTVDATVDCASGVEICHTLLITRAGEGWALPASDKRDAQEAAAAIRAFLGIGG